MKIKWSLNKIALCALFSFILGSAGLAVMYQQGTLQDLSAPVEMEKSFDSDKLDTISITTDTANTTFVPSKDGRLTVRMSGTINRSLLPYAGIETAPHSEDSALDITIRTNKRYQIGIDVGQAFYDIRNGFKSNVRVQVELPDKVYKTLRLKSNTGQLVLPAVKADVLELESDTGDISLQGFAGTRLTARTDTGTMRFKHVTGALDLKSDTGDFYVEVDRLLEDSRLQTDTGDINLTVNGSYPFEADFRSDTGKTTAKSSSESTFSFEWQEKHKLRGKTGNGGPLVKASTDTGDIALEVRQAGSATSP